MHKGEGWANRLRLGLLLWLSTEAVAFFTPRPRPYFSLLAHSCLIYWETLSARLSKLNDYGFDQLVSQCNWHHLLNEKRRYRPIRNMITGLLLIGLGFALGYRRIQKMGTAVQSLTRLPIMIEAVGRAISIETETINRNMDFITEKLTALQRKIDGGDQNGQRE